MRSAWLSWGLVVLVGAAVPLACGEAFSATGSTGTGGSSSMATGPGGDATAAGGGGDTPTSTTTTTTATTTGTGSGTCLTTADCTASATVCGTPFCVNGNCGFKSTKPNGPTDSQVYGDCHTIKCDFGLVVNAVDDTDVYDDANACTEDLCAKGAPTNLPLAAGVECSMGSTVCDGKKACVECVSNSDCVDPKVCHVNRCVPTTCFDGTKTSANAETDTDCGGSTCQPCSENQFCLFDSDCESHLCKVPMGGVALKCTLASCGDGVKNGAETDRDCGGPDCAEQCPVDDACNVPGDCTSRVCMGGKCIAAKCTDGVKNGNELGIDCGNGCPDCPGG